MKIPSPRFEEVLEMLSQARSTPVDSLAPGVIPDRVTGPVTTGSAVVIDPDLTTAGAFASLASDRETRRGRSSRTAHRLRMHGYAIVAVALVVFLIRLAASNTAHIKVNWVFGTSHVSLVWPVLFAAILGWLLGLVVTAAFHWRTRAPRRQRERRS